MCIGLPICRILEECRVIVKNSGNINAGVGITQSYYVYRTTYLQETGGVPSHCEEQWEH